MLKAGYAYHGEANIVQMFHVHVHVCTSVPLGYISFPPLSPEKLTSLSLQ